VNSCTHSAQLTTVTSSLNVSPSSKPWQHQLGAAEDVLRELLGAEAEGDAGDAAGGQQRLHIHSHAVQHLRSGCSRVLR